MKHLKTFESDSTSTRKLHDKIDPNILTPREITNMYFYPLIDNIQKLDNEIASNLITYYKQQLDALTSANKFNV